eukprot:2636367-Rhodomonas_salina.2
MSIVCHMTPDMVAESVKLLKLPERHLVPSCAPGMRCPDPLPEARTGRCWSTPAAKTRSGIGVQLQSLGRYRDPEVNRDGRKERRKRRRLRRCMMGWEEGK